MGKAGKWFRSLLSSKKTPSPPSDTEPSAPPERKKGDKSKRGFSKSGDKFKNVEKNPLASPYHEGLDANKHAIAVAAATAAVAEAALAAAQAAAEVVKLTSGGVSSRGGDRRRVVAAVKIQSAFRAYLAKRALRALKGLVKLQAHVRGHIVRKQSADMLRRMQAMARIQARASVNRAYPIEPPYTKINSFNSHRQGIVNLRKYGERSNIVKHGESTHKQYNSRPYSTNNNTNKQNQIASNWLDHWMERNAWNNNQDDERNDKILEIDTWKPRHNTRRNDKNTLVPSQHVPSWNDSGLEYPKISSSSRLQEKLQKPIPSVSSEEVSSVISEKFPLSASSRPTSNMRGPFTPTRSECSRSMFGDYMGHPSYMANTESSRAKVRSQSAPKQRMQLEELNLSWMFGRGLLESDAVSEKGLTQPFNYKNNAYVNSSNFRRQGSSTHDVGYGYSSSHGHRF